MVSMWSEVPSGDLAKWNQHLLAAGAPLWQLPFWKACIDRPGVRARYFLQGSPGRATAWACVVDCGLPGVQVGLVQDGPVNLAEPGRLVDTESLAALCAMCRSHGQLFVRFSHSEPSLATVGALPGAVARDFFPYFVRTRGWDLHVPLAGDEDELLERFQWRARNAIKRATKTGYEVISGTSDDVLRQAHRLFLGVAERKQFRMWSYPKLAAMVRESAVIDGARVYLARQPGSEPVSAILVVNDGVASHYLFGGVDPVGASGEVSPTTLLHWRAMQDAIHRGLSVYNLGSRAPASVGQFKQRFRPVEVPPPSSVTVVLRPLACAGWQNSVLPVSQQLWPTIARARLWLWQRQRGLMHQA
jgi:hypothetical protein